MKISDKLKWVGTFLVLTGIALTNINYYPLNIFIHGSGVIFGPLVDIYQKIKPYSLTLVSKYQYLFLVY